ncbi:MAG TPA: LPS export ABC transporter permease LptG [Candidatus Binataceae bacterium]|jgi:lipopolysaccharide export system permease protein|nr:LPS export ABC transporter permease LptG [Candidatus Binataceae bacterium]
MNDRPRLSPTVDRFLMTRFMEPFVFSLGAFTAIYMLGDFFERFDELIRYKSPGWLGLEYFALRVPLVVSQLLPIACLTGVLLAFSLLNRSGELLAFQGLGISRLELAAPVLVISLMVSLLDFGLSETVVPVATRQARYLYDVEIKHGVLEGVFAFHRLWLRPRDGFLTVERYDGRNPPQLFGVTFFQMGPDQRLIEVHEADSAAWDGKQWRLTNVRRYQIDDRGQVTTVNEPSFQIGFKPADFILVRQDPEEFSLSELNHYIHSLRRKGLAPGGYLVDRDLKYATPLACLIMAALGIALSINPLPRQLSLGRSFGLGTVIGFGYWVALGFTSSFGHSELIPAWLAAWLPNAVFAILAVSIFLFGEEY